MKWWSDFGWKLCSYSKHIKCWSNQTDPCPPMEPHEPSLPGILLWSWFCCLDRGGG